MWLYSPSAHNCTGWARSHCILTQYAPTITQNSGCCFHSTFPTEVDTEMIIRAWCVTVNNVRPPWRKTWKWGYTAQLSWINCWMSKWISTMTHVMLLWTNTQVPDATQRIFSVTNVPPIAVHMSEMWCSGQGNLHFMQEMEHAPTQVMIWASITSIIWLDLIQQRWRQGSNLSSETGDSLMTWAAARSPDITTLDDSLWGSIKGRLGACRYTTNKELWTAVEYTFNTITSRMLQRMSHRTWRCISLYVQHQGAQTDPLDMQLRTA